MHHYVPSLFMPLKTLWNHHLIVGSVSNSLPSFSAEIMNPKRKNIWDEGRTHTCPLPIYTTTAALASVSEDMKPCFVRFSDTTVNESGASEFKRFVNHFAKAAAKIGLYINICHAAIHKHNFKGQTLQQVSIFCLWDSLNHSRLIILQQRAENTELNPHTKVKAKICRTHFPCIAWTTAL